MSSEIKRMRLIKEGLRLADDLYKGKYRKVGYETLGGYTKTSKGWRKINLSKSKKDSLEKTRVKKNDDKSISFNNEIIWYKRGDKATGYSSGQLIKYDDGNATVNHSIFGVEKIPFEHLELGIQNKIKEMIKKNASNLISQSAKEINMASKALENIKNKSNK